MYVEQFRDYCLSKVGVTEEFPFDEHTLVFKVMGKVFAIVPLERNPSQANLKCDPARAETLREEYDGLIYPGFHMNKKHWNTVLLAERLPAKLVMELIDHSYDLVVAKFTKALRAQWEELGGKL